MVLQKEQDYECGMLVSDCSGLDLDFIVVGLFFINNNSKPCTLKKIQFKSSEASSASEVMSWAADLGTLKEKLYNCFVLSAKDLVVVTSTQIILKDLDTFNTVKQVSISATNDCLNLVYNCQLGIQQDSDTSFILSARPRVSASQKDFNPKTLSNGYEGSNRKGVLSWLIKAKFNTETLTFECKDYKTNSILFTNEYIISAFEFDEGCLLVHIADTDILLVRDWQVQKLIADPDAGNNSKYWF